MLPFHNLSQDTLNHMLPGQRAMQDTLLATDVETVTSGAISTTLPVTHVSCTGAQAYTLADGPAGTAGMIKYIKCTVAASTPVGTLTITSPETVAGMVCPATMIFDTVGQEVALFWTGTKWRVITARRAGNKTVVVGTTVLTGQVLNLLYDTSVTGTVSSTGTKAIPDGLYPGDICHVGCSTAAATPIGNINFTGLTLAAAAVTDLQAIGATTDTVSLAWTGTKWLVVANSGITVA